MAFTPPEQAEQVGPALAEIVAERGPDALSRPEVLTSLLADLLPGADRLVQLVAAAAQCRVADDLCGHVAQGMDAGTAATLVGSSFAAATLYTPEACAWVVTEFASALGLTTPAAPDVIPAGTGSAAVMSLTRQAPGGDLGGAPTVTAYPPAAAAPGDSPAGPTVYAERQRESGVVKSGFPDWDPQVSKRFWYLAAYLLPVIGFGWIGIPILVVLMIVFSLARRDRLFMMNAIQSLEICLIGGLVVAFGIVAYRVPAYSVFYGILAGASGGLTILLLIFCISKLARRKQPRIKVLSNIAFRLAYGRNSR